MTRRGGTLGQIIRLGENPEFGDEADPYGEDDQDEFGGLGDDMGSMDDEESPFAMKGRRVNGPRTKLSASMDPTTLAKGQRVLQKQIGQLAQSINFLARIEKGRLSKHDPMGGGDPMADPMSGDPMGGGYPDEDPMGLPGDEDEDEMQLDLAAGPQLRATGEGTSLNVRKAQLAKARTAQLQKAAAILRKSGYTIGKVSKDDAATSFGEKDSNVTGNRPVDTESVGEDDTVIQGGPGAGPGPVSKGNGSLDVQSMISKSIAEAFASYGMKPAQQDATVMKSVSPAPGGVTGSQINKGTDGAVDLGNLFDTLKDRSFHEINKIRVQMGDLSGGVL